MGLLYAMTALSQLAALPLQHLRAVNPYVTGAIELGGRMGGWALPRDPSGQPMPRSGIQVQILVYMYFGMLYEVVL